MQKAVGKKEHLVISTMLSCQALKGAVITLISEYSATQLCGSFSWLAIIAYYTLA